MRDPCNTERQNHGVSLMEISVFVPLNFDAAHISRTGASLGDRVVRGCKAHTFHDLACSLAHTNAPLCIPTSLHAPIPRPSRLRSRQHFAMRCVAGQSRYARQSQPRRSPQISRRVPVGSPGHRNAPLALVAHSSRRDPAHPPLAQLTRVQANMDPGRLASDAA
jgi:hypothetical protein